MIAYLDANIVIYFVEQHTTWGPKVKARLQTLRAAGDDVATSDLSRLECLVAPYAKSTAKLIADFASFFSNPDVHVFPLPTPVFDRAAKIRARHRYSALDSLHLAVAVDTGCGLFLTNDVQLAKFPDITVEVIT
jgi:predicted nucleic acid-binding protein